MEGIITRKFQVAVASVDSVTDYIRATTAAFLGLTEKSTDELDRALSSSNAVSKFVSDHGTHILVVDRTLQAGKQMIKEERLLVKLVKINLGIRSHRISSRKVENKGALILFFASRQCEAHFTLKLLKHLT